MSKFLPIKEFVEDGYLQEVNRKLLHRLGLALAVEKSGDEYKLLGVYDHRNEPAGMAFAEEVTSNEGFREKIRRVDGELLHRDALRSTRLKFIIQPPTRDTRGG